MLLEVLQVRSPCFWKDRSPFSVLCRPRAGPRPPALGGASACEALSHLFHLLHLSFLVTPH